MAYKRTDRQTHIQTGKHTYMQTNRPANNRHKQTHRTRRGKGRQAIQTDEARSQNSTINKHTDKHTDTQTDQHTNSQKSSQTKTQTNSRSNRQTGSQANKHTGKTQTHRQIRGTGRRANQLYRQTDGTHRNNIRQHGQKRTHAHNHANKPRQ